MTPVTKFDADSPSAVVTILVALNIAPTIGSLLTATLLIDGPILTPYEAPACPIPRGGPQTWPASP